MTLWGRDYLLSRFSGRAFVYVLRLENGKVYVGMTSDLVRRWYDHVNRGGANWTRQHRPLEVVWWCECKDVVEALDVEDRVTLRIAAAGWDVRGGHWLNCEPSALVRLRERASRLIEK